MSNSDQPKDQPKPPVKLTPGEIARQAAEEAAEAMKRHIQGRPSDIEPERSGQLSPPHTPGRSRK